MTSVVMSQTAHAKYKWPPCHWMKIPHENFLRTLLTPGIRNEAHRSLMICSAVWASPGPQGHQGSGAIFHRCSDSRKFPTRVLSRFGLLHPERLRLRSGFPTSGGSQGSSHHLATPVSYKCFQLIKLQPSIQRVEYSIMQQVTTFMYDSCCTKNAKLNENV